MKTVPFLLAALLLLFCACDATAAPYTRLINRAGTALSVPAPLIHAIIKVESNYRPDAVSSAGAVGLMQLMPAYGAREAYHYLYGSDGRPSKWELKNPVMNVWLGTAYIKLLRTRYFGWIHNDSVRLRAVLAAYNWGPSAVSQHILSTRKPLSVARFMHELMTKAPKGTNVYVRRVLAILN